MGKIFMQGRATEKKIVLRKNEEEKISAEWIALSGLQTVLAWMATWQPLYTAVLISLSWCNPHWPGFLYNYESGHFSLSRLIHFVPSNLIMDTVAKIACRKTLMDNHSLKVIKKTMFYKQPSCLICWQLSKHIPCFSQLICINDDCGHRCAHPWRTVTLSLRWPLRSTSDKRHNQRLSVRFLITHLMRLVWAISIQFRFLTK